MARWFLLLLSGCSLSLTGPSPERPRNKAPVCDTSKGLVVADSLLAATMGVIAISVAGSTNGGGAAVVPVLFGGLFVASAVHGNNVVNGCRREIGNYESETAQVEPPAPPLRRDNQPAFAMQPAVTVPMASTVLPSQQLQPSPAPQPPPQQEPQAPPQQEAQPPPQPAPQPAPQQAQQPQPAPPSNAGDEPWAAFWKEVR